MSLIAVFLNLVLAGLLVAALVMGMGLNRKLKALRDSHEGFAKAVADLDAAALRAEQGLADLRAATDEAAETLGERMERARALVSKLDERLARPLPAGGSPARAHAELATQADSRSAARARIEALTDSNLERRNQWAAEEFARPRMAASEPARTRPAAVDGDLFEGVTLKALAGGRR